MKSGSRIILDKVEIGLWWSLGMLAHKTFWNGWGRLRFMVVTALQRLFTGLLIYLMGRNICLEIVLDSMRWFKLVCVQCLCLREGSRPNLDGICEGGEGLFPIANISLLIFVLRKANFLSWISIKICNRIFSKQVGGGNQWQFNSSNLQSN